jgi:hypothetical protein
MENFNKMTLGEIANAVESLEIESAIGTFGKYAIAHRIREISKQQPGCADAVAQYKGVIP